MLVAENAFPTALSKALKETFLLDGAKQSYANWLRLWESWKTN